MLNILIIYLMEALAISIVAYYIPKNVLSIIEILKITLTGAIVHLLLDLYAPQVAVGLRFGTGMSIGKNMINKPVSLFGGENNTCNDLCEDSQGNTDEECLDLCNETDLVGGSSGNNHSVNNNCNDICLDSEGNIDEECLDLCNETKLVGGQIKSYPMVLNGGENNNSSLFAACEEAGMSNEECIELEKTLKGGETEFDICSDENRALLSDGKDMTKDECEQLGL